MTIVKQIFGNYLLMSALCAWLIAQVLKVFTGMFSEQKFSFFKLFFSNGGMPSSHSATVMALTTACAISYGFGSFCHFADRLYHRDERRFRRPL